MPLPIVEILQCLKVRNIAFELATILLHRDARVVIFAEVDPHPRLHLGEPLDERIVIHRRLLRRVAAGIDDKVPALGERIRVQAVQCLVLGHISLLRR